MRFLQLGAVLLREQRLDGSEQAVDPAEVDEGIIDCLSTRQLYVYHYHHNHHHHHHHLSMSYVYGKCITTSVYL